MTEAAIPALQNLQRDALTLAKSLSESEWMLPSDCAGWTVRDVYAHMAGVYHGLVDPSFMRTGDDPNDMEAGMEVGVAERREWPIADLIAEFEEFSVKACENFAGMQHGDIATMEIPMGNLGTHPLHILANAFVFDAYCHLRNDLVAPFGLLDRDVPAASEEHLAPILEWMLAGLPQMCAAALAFMHAPVVLQLDGPGGGSFIIGDATIAPVATIVSTPDAFVRWGTQRRPWRDEGVMLLGDESYAARVVDACNII